VVSGAWALTVPAAQRRDARGPCPGAYFPGGAARPARSVVTAGPRASSSLDGSLEPVKPTFPVGLQQFLDELPFDLVGGIQASLQVRENQRFAPACPQFLAQGGLQAGPPLLLFEVRAMARGSKPALQPIGEFDLLQAELRPLEPGLGFRHDGYVDAGRGPAP